jgi:antitoxin component YwqK of YwqJK toxin-antitoxin module
MGDPNITMSQGKIFYRDKAFTGRIRQENLVMEEFFITSYKDGMEDGEYIAQKKSGQLLEKRFFKAGQKHGIHRSWFPNGNNRLYSEFDNGKYINDRWEWYDTGKPYIYEKFDKNGKILVSKTWNRVGHIYMNIAFTQNGSSAGMPGSKICNPIKSVENKGKE